MDFNSMTLDALTALAEEKRTALKTMLAVENPTDDQITEAAAARKELADIEAAVKIKTEARANFDAMRAEFSDDAEGGDEEEGDGEDGDGEDAGADESAEGAEGAEAAAEEPVDAAAEAEVKDTKAAGKGVTRLARKSTRPAPPADAEDPNKIIIRAANEVPGFDTGQELDDLTKVAEAVIARARGFGIPQGDGESVSLQKFGTAMLSLHFDDDLIVDERDSTFAIAEAMDRAVDESQLPGGSLVAAGGWCAPSETMYDLTQDATMDGMLSLPEIGVRRGGIRFAMSPTFADFYANPGFIQTEAQAIAGTTKPCIEIDCPDFTDVRLDAEGICIKVPILTNAAYPEVVRNFVAGSMVAHAHWINANVIGRLVTVAGAARVFTGLGSTYSDTLEALALVVDQTRQKYRLGLKATIEVVVPFWVRNAFRIDLARRTARASAAVTDGEIDSHFSVIGANVQYVYDWQNLDLVEDEVPVGDDINAYPASFQALAYPAGTFVKGTAPVINLNTVYDAASLAENVYTGLFFEQGLLVAHKKFDADLLTLPICNAGRTGAADLTCA